MQNAGSRRHPLNFSIPNGILIPQAVPMSHTPAIYVTDRLDPCGVHGKSRYVVIGIHAVKRIKQQYGVEFLYGPAPQHSTNFTPAPSWVL